MKILILGSSGFIGSQVIKEISENHDTYGAGLGGNESQKYVKTDLLDKASIKNALNKVRPAVIINCAGVVDNSSKSDVNPIFTTNLVDAVAECGLSIDKIIISGSAAEYGPVDQDNIPVKEETPLNAVSGYGLSKLKETQAAGRLAEKYKLPVVIARIFNPIGTGMHPRLLLPSLIRQIYDIKAGKADFIEVSRLDAKRDYIDVSDVAKAMGLLAENKLKHNVYNVGSGKSVSTQHLIELISKATGLATMPKVTETSTQPEQLVAVQADISRIINELGWTPARTIEDTIQEIANDAR